VAEDWSPEEIKVIVAAYRSMIIDEIAGQPINKAESNRNVRKQIERSKGSVEFKHQNISAVLHDLGLYYIDGYKPRDNYQASLADEVLAWLTESQVEAEILTKFVGQAQEPLTQSSDIFLPAPTARVENVVRRTVVRRWDGAARDAANRELGKKGEAFVFELEKNRLNAAGRPDLAAKVRWVSQEIGDGLGYDIESYNIDGSPLFIEVKTTKGSEISPFFLTGNELLVSGKLATHYRLYRVYNFPVAPRIFVLHPPLEASVRLRPVLYQADFTN
jgi:hypothetical protein